MPTQKQSLPQKVIVKKITQSICNKLGLLGSFQPLFRQDSDFPKSKCCGTHWRCSDEKPEPPSSDSAVTNNPFLPSTVVQVSYGSSGCMQHRFFILWQRSYVFNIVLPNPLIRKENLLLVFLILTSPNTRLSMFNIVCLFYKKSSSLLGI